MGSDKYTLEQIIDNFKDLAIKHSDAAEKSDHRKANRIFDKLENLFNRFQGDDILADKIITNLLKDDDIRIRVQAAMISLSLKKHIQEAKKILKQAEQQTDFRILRVDAHMALKVWREQGYF